MSDPSLKPSNFFLRKMVEKTEKSIYRKHKRLTTGGIISDQSFGFWTSLFDTHHYKLIKGTVIHIFPNKPQNENRSHINLKLNSIREFRNRIYHNEPICFNGDKVDFTKTENARNNITEMLQWIDVNISNYISQYDNIVSKIEHAKNIYPIGSRNS